MSVGTNLVNSGAIELATPNFGFGNGGSTLTVGGTLTNAAAGSLFIVDDATSATVVRTTALVNDGYILIVGTVGAAELIVGLAAPATWTGTASVGGNTGGNALLEFASGQITSIGTDGTLAITGPTAFVADAGDPTQNSALDSLASVAGGLYVNNAVVSLSGGLTVTGVLDISNETSFGTQITGTAGLHMPGTLINNGSIGFEGGGVGITVGALVNNHNLTLASTAGFTQANYLSVATNLTNSGAIKVFGYSNATLTVAGTLTNTAAGSLAIYDTGPAAAVVQTGALINDGAIDMDGAGSGKAELIITSGSNQGSIQLSGNAVMSAGSMITQNGGDVLIGNGAIGYNGVVGDQGVESVYGIANNPTITNGGAIDVHFGGTASGTTVSSGGSLAVSAGGVASATVVLAGGSETVIGTETDALINGGSVFVESGGVASDTTIDAGTLTVLGGGTVNDTTVAGGFEEVAAGGFASGTTLDLYSRERVDSGGVTSGTTISGGTLTVLGGGTASGTVVDAYGLAIIRGTADGVEINAGGFAIVGPFGTASDLTINGGFVEVMSRGRIGQTPITFANGGVLRLDASSSFHGQIAGFGAPDILDLRDIAFGLRTTVAFTEAASNTSGTLTVTGGTGSANLTLLGSYTTSDFHLSGDGHGGTLVTDLPPAMGPDLRPLSFADLDMPAFGQPDGALPGSPGGQNYGGAPPPLPPDQGGGVSFALLQTVQHSGLPPPN